MKIKNIMKQKRTIAAAVLAILMFPSGLQAKDNTVPANYVPADLLSADNDTTVPSDFQSAGIAGNNRITNPVEQILIKGIFAISKRRRCLHIMPGES